MPAGRAVPLVAAVIAVTTRRSVPTRLNAPWAPSSKTLQPWCGTQSAVRLVIPAAVVGQLVALEVKMQNCEAVPNFGARGSDYFSLT